MFNIPVVGEKILNWEFNSGYMRLEVFAEGHHGGIGRLENHGWRGNETVWERDVYLRHNSGEVVIKNSPYFMNYPESIRLLIRPFEQAFLKKDQKEKEEILQLVRSNGFDLAFTNSGVRVCVPNSPQFHSTIRSTVIQ